MKIWWTKLMSLVLVGGRQDRTGMEGEILLGLLFCFPM